MNCPKCEPSRGRSWPVSLGIVLAVLGGIALLEWKDGTLEPASPAVMKSERTESAVKSTFESELSLAYPASAPDVARTRRFELRATPTEVQQFDGRMLKVWAYNGQVPGPVLRVRLGDAVEVRLKNDLSQATTIHWHGVRVPNAMDGVPGVTQEPVAPGDSFTYRFRRRCD